MFNSSRLETEGNLALYSDICFSLNIEVRSSNTQLSSPDVRTALSLSDVYASCHSLHVWHGSGPNLELAALETQVPL
jgi:hypothetical protein